VTNQLSDLRALDSVDDLIDDLTVQMRNTLDDLDRQLERITAVRATVASALDALKPTPVADTPPTAKLTATLTIVPTAKTVATPAAFICDVCGDVLASANGLAIHKGRKHKDRDVWTPEPITKTGVDEVAARAAAAAAL
jgi:hypothetical protein